MRTVEINLDNQKIVLRAATRRTPITAATYQRILVDALPGVKDVRDAPPGDTDKLALQQLDSMITFNETSTFSAVAARIYSASGDVFQAMEGYIPAEDLTALFNHVLDEEPDDPNGLWKKIVDAVVQLDAPLTPIEASPPGALTEAQRTSPL